MVDLNDVIDAGAKALHGYVKVETPWEDLSRDSKDGYREQACLVLESAIGIIAAKFVQSRGEDTTRSQATA